MMYRRNDDRSEVSIASPQDGGVDFWTYDAVVGRLVEAMRLWWRSPGGGKWPFAADAPWHLMTRAARLDAGRVKGMDLARLLQEDDERETAIWLGRERARPLTREDVARRDEATEWLAFVPAGDRRLVVSALAALASGAKNVPWMGIWKSLGRGRPGPDGLRWRFDQAMRRIAEALNRRKSA